MKKFEQLISKFEIDPNVDYLLILSTDSGINPADYPQISDLVGTRFGDRINILVVKGDVRKVVNIIKK